MVQNKEPMGDDKNIDHFCNDELGWREFSHYLIHHFSFMPQREPKQYFDAFPWRIMQISFNHGLGETGYPIVDLRGMKELWETGYMHNRVKMIVGSFLVEKYCHWSYGRDWFNRYCT